MSNYQTICRVEDVPEGSARMFIVDETQVGVFRIEDRFFAVDNRCPHAGASLAHGFIEGVTVACRIHHWRFDLRDGTRLDHHCPGVRLRCYPIRIMGEEIQVDLTSAR